MDAIARQVVGIASLWRLLAIPSLSLASFLAAGKARIDLRDALDVFEEQGISVRLLGLAVAFLAGLVCIAGYTYGIIMFDFITSLAGSVSEAYLPPPPPNVWDAVYVAVPIAVVSHVSALAGWEAWRLRG